MTSITIGFSVILAVLYFSSRKLVLMYRSGKRYTLYIYIFQLIIVGGLFSVLEENSLEVSWLDFGLWLAMLIVNLIAVSKMLSTKS
ncbi:hypothetical protein KP803_21725 [Vibrio sp. ZSDE26]|uniref:Uncharacterized protein n=1 Tax=Vibrio amylolyticus TaxID=2847292 RepID=A0A9X2BK51_9VIBR|nr:hypothetical protein [Vibrio amylolyticus]MCK6265880.1 hypothetical protein [Vibrio amylolyticus]